MAFKSIKDFPESTSPSGEWFALVDDGTGCYYKVKLKNLPGGGFTTTSSTTTRLTTTSTTTTAAGTTSTTTTRLTTSTTTTAVPASTTTSTTSSTSTSSTSSTTSTTTTIVYEPAAQAFFTAAGITSVTDPTGTQRGAVNNLVIALQNNGLWTKMKAIYPFVGGTANAHKLNLKDPRDLDAAFRIVFNGGVTHSAQGVLFNGSTGYGDTKFSISDFASTTNLSYGVYIRTQGTGFDIGIYDFVGLVSAYNFIWSSSRRFYYNSNSATPQFLTWSSSGPYGFIAGSINGTAGTVYRNGALGQSGTTPNDAIPIPGIFWYIGNVNDGSNVPEPSSWSNNQYAFAYLGDSLTTLEMTSLYTAVQNYQIALSRQV